MDVDELVSTIEIAKRLKLKTAHLVRAWRRRYAAFSQRVRTSEGGRSSPGGLPADRGSPG